MMSDVTGSESAPSETYRKLRDLLYELFQFDQADLDFGIYRIMNQKRDEISSFLDNDLLPQVSATLSEYHASEAAAVQTELDKLRVSLQSAGVPPENSPRYRELQDRLATVSADPQVENEIYSDLYTFFRRYYQDGDFISQRRYKDGVYAIPYAGEEVKLHWANADQYYVKTTENFQDYRFRLPDDRHVHFRLTAAETERDNNRAASGQERRFVLRSEDPVAVVDGELHIYFAYQTNKQKQATLNADAADAIFGLAGIEDWKTSLATPASTASNGSRTLLAKHLSDYTAKNSYDYFIHKDLGGFLRRELDFFLKNEVMQIDDLDTDDERHADQYLARLRAIKRIGQKIIAFLAQLEEFQKRLFLKKKFVVSTEYCVTLDRVPEALYDEIVTNDAQWEEWERLFAISEISPGLLNGGPTRRSADWLRANQYAAIDTCFFDESFKMEWLESIDTVDAVTDGLLVNGDNFHALTLLKSRYGASIRCVHIDPPYNTHTSGFLYKNSYQHSSWLSMMIDRLQLSTALLDENGSLLCHIDENEYERLALLCDSLGLPDAGTIIWDKKNPMLGRSGIATRHEYILWRTWQVGAIYLSAKNVSTILAAAGKIIDSHNGVTDAAKLEFSNWIASQPDLTGGERAYRLLDDDGRVYQSVAMGAPEPRTDPKFFIPLLHPVTGHPCPVPSNGWSRAPETMQGLLKKGEIVFGATESTQPRRKVYLTESSRRQISSVIEDSSRGKQDVDRLGLDFPYCHPLNLYQTLLGASTDSDSTIIDFFAGSGTNGHATIQLNRGDGGHRKYILVEMGEQFHTVLKPRMLKAVYSSDWKSGKPVARDGLSQLFRYQLLESYEDTLNNLRLRERSGVQQKLIDEMPSLREDYLLSYCLDLETDDSASLLDLDAFDTPFEYQLTITQGGESRVVTVDLPETFNYLLGLRVEKLRFPGDFRTVEGIDPNGKRVVVIWRSLRDPASDNDALEALFTEQGYADRPPETAIDRVYVNGDNTLLNLRPEGASWDVLLTEQEFKRLMFADADGGV